MKKVKHLLFPLALLLALVLFTSCSFVQYTRYDHEDTAALEEARQKYLAKIETLYDTDYYAEEERILFEIALQDAINELNECKSVEAINEAYERHTAAIDAIPTQLSLIRGEYLERLHAHLALDDYRKEEQTQIRALLADYEAKMLSADSKELIDALLRRYQTEVYELKTKDMYEANELLLHKEEIKKEIVGIKNPVLYRQEEQKTIETLINTFLGEIDSFTDKDALLARYGDVIAALDALTTIEEYYAIEKAALIEEKLALIQSYADTYHFAAEDAQVLTQTLNALSTKEAIIAYTADYLFEQVAASPNATAQTLYTLALDSLSNTIVIEDYWNTDQEDIKAFIEKSAEELSQKNDPDTIQASLKEMKATLLAYPSAEERWQSTEAAFARDLATLYGDATLKAPEKLREAANYEELAAIIDYYAFYQTSYTTFLQNRFRVKLTYPHKTAQWEINEVYWYCELIRSAVGITGYFEKDGDTLVIELIPYAIATQKNTKEPAKVDRYTSLVGFDGKQYEKRADDFNDFAYLNYEKTLNGVWNTQQLWYALEHEYVPICVPDSRAEEILERAKEILREVVCDGMTIEEKAYAIYAWYGRNVTYDEDYREYLYPTDRKHFPDELAATLNSFHAEGALLDNLAVCCSFAKSYLILLRIEGIEAYRMFVREYTDNAIDNLGKIGYGSHAFVILRASDGLFYYSDTEEAYNTSIDSFLIKHEQFFTTADTRWPYENGTTNMYKDFVFAEGLPKLYATQLTYAHHPIAVQSEASLLEMLNAFDNEIGEKLQFSVIESKDTPFSVKDYLTQDGRFSYKTFSFGGVTEYMIYK